MSTTTGNQLKTITEIPNLSSWNVVTEAGEEVMTLFTA